MLINKEKLKQENEVNVYSLKKYSFIIPYFQRLYCWKEKEIQKFLDELLLKIQDENEESIYLLRFIFSEKSEKEMFVVDGQQRLISLNLLIKAIKKIKEDADIDNFNISFEDLEIQKKYDKIKSPFKKNFFHIKKWIENNEKNNEDFFKKIVEIIKEKIFIDYTKCDDLNDAFEMFNLLNSGGKKLNNQEIISSWFKNKNKNNNFNYNEKKLKCYCSVYYSIISFEKRIEHEKNFNFDIKKINDFFRRVESEKEFNNFCETIENFEEKQKKNNFIFDIIEDINRTQISKIVYLMFYKKMNIKEEKNKHLLFGLCLLSITMSLKNTNPGGIIMKLYSDICDEILGKIPGHVNNKTINEKFRNFIIKNKEFLIKYSEFIEYLSRNKKLNKIKSAIFKIDLYLNNNSGEFKDLEIEHIFAIQDDSTCFISPHTDKNEEMKENIGNLLLINKTKNKKLSNKKVKDKLMLYGEIFEEEKGLHYKEGINFIDVKKVEPNKFGDFILKRQKEIIEYIYNKFPSAKEIIKKEK